MHTHARPRLNAIAGPILGEFLVGMSVAMAGLWLASQTSDIAAGAFGMSNQVMETLFVLFRVLAIGVGAGITQAVGGQRPEAARRTALVGLGASTWAGAFVASWMLLANEWTLDVLNAPLGVSRLAAPYLQVLALAMVLEAYNLTMAAILRAHLHARDTLQVMLVMHSVHLALAFVLMRGVGSWDGLGLYGYAIGLIVSRVVGLVMHLRFWRLRLKLAPTRHDWWVCPVRALMPVLRTGVPAASLELVYRIGFMMSLAAAARLGVPSLAAQAYTLQTLKYVMLVSLSIGWACEIMVGHLVGAGEFRTAHQLVRKGLRNGVLAFTRDPEVIEAAQTLLWIAFALETGRVANIVVLGALRATGDVVYPVAASMASLILVLGVGSVVLGRTFGLPGIFIAYAADEWIRGTILFHRWSTHGWVHHARVIYQRMRAPGAETRF